MMPMRQNRPEVPRVEEMREKWRRRRGSEHTGQVRSEERIMN